MLSRETMGLVALAILWVNTLLIAGAAWKQRAELVRIRNGLGAVKRATIIRGNGPAGAFAALEVRQVGRLTSASVPTIVFHDQAYSSVLYGGSLREGVREIEVEASEAVEVWLDAPAVRDADSCSTTGADFEAACLDAKKARGFARVLHAPIVSGREVFLATSSRSGESKVYESCRLVSTLDPGAWLRQKANLALLFMVVEIFIAAACTAACLHPPVFGLVSTVGGAASLAFFLIVQPVGAVVRDAMRVPSRAIQRGTWTRGERASATH